MVAAPPVFVETAAWVTCSLFFKYAAVTLAEAGAEMVTTFGKTNMPGVSITSTGSGIMEIFFAGCAYAETARQAEKNNTDNFFIRR